MDVNNDLISLIRNPSGYWNKDKSLLKKKLIELGLIYVGCGCTRLCFKANIYSKYVIKIPHKVHGWWANQEEVDYAKKYPQLVAKCRMFGKSSIMRNLLIEGDAEDDCPEDHPLYLLGQEASESLIDDGWQVGRHPETKQLLFYDFTRY